MIKLSTAVAGFSVVSAVLLFLVYAFFRRPQGKSAYSIFFCAVVTAALATIQIFHFHYFRAWGVGPLAELPYRLALFVVPSSMYLFSRWATQPSAPFRPIYLLHLLPVLLPFFVDLKIALPILFLTGVGYLLWLAWFLFGLRAHFRKFLFELLCYLVMWITAMATLGFGFIIPFRDDAYFYLFSANAIGLCLAITMVVLIVNSATASSSEGRRSRGRRRSHHPPHR
jgi:hypothetical protein